MDIAEVGSATIEAQTDAWGAKLRAVLTDTSDKAVQLKTKPPRA